MELTREDSGHSSDGESLSFFYDAASVDSVDWDEAFYKLIREFPVGVWIVKLENESKSLRMVYVNTIAESHRFDRISCC